MEGLNGQTQLLVRETPARLVEEAKERGKAAAESCDAISTGPGGAASAGRRSYGKGVVSPAPRSTRTERERASRRAHARFNSLAGVRRAKLSAYWLTPVDYPQVAPESSCAKAKAQNANQLRLLLPAYCPVSSSDVRYRDAARNRQRATRAATQAPHRRRARLSDPSCLGTGVARRQTARRRGGYLMIAPYASPTIRDQFLTALDAHDRDLCTRLALNLIDCGNPLPGMTCDQLGLPIGSTYGSAARRVLLLYAVP
jgi:hypothetical protein